MKTNIANSIFHFFASSCLFLFSNILPAILVQPYNIIDALHTDSAVYVCWKSSTDATISYGMNDFSQTKAGSGRGAHLTGLVPGARYQYKVVCAGDTSVIGSFRTSRAGTPFSFAIFGDTQAVGSRETAFLREIYQYFHPDLLVIAGDLIASDNSVGADCCYDSLFSHVPELFSNTLLVPLRGNHDAKPLFKSTFSMLPDSGLHYLFTYGNTGFVLIEYDDDFIFRNSLLDEMFAALKTVFKVGVSHQPIYYPDGASSWNYVIGDPFEKGGGNVWYSGDTHYYHRTLWLKSNTCYGCPAPVDVSASQKQGNSVYCGAGAPSGWTLPDSQESYIASSSSRPAYSIVNVDSQLYSHRAYYAVSGRTVFDSFFVLPAQAVSTEAPAGRSPLLMACSPNPFFSECGISVLRGTGRGKLRIFGVSGKKVLELDLQAPFTFRWKARDLANGFYIVDWKAKGPSLRESLFLLR